VLQKEGEIVSVIQEVLTSIRVVKAFAREEFEQHRLEEESFEGVEIALRARGLKGFPPWSKLSLPWAQAWSCGLAHTLSVKLPRGT
jgi:ABC-type multidrug transport system fused ATPase/permease subunit